MTNDRWGAVMGEVMRVLLVEDDEDLSDVITVSLETEGYETRSTSKGIDAITIAKSFEPHAIVLDVGLPDLNGWTVAMMIRKFNMSTKIFLFTGWAHLSELPQAHTEHVNSVLVKPHDVNRLFAELAEADRARNAGTHP